MICQNYLRHADNEPTPRGALTLRNCSSSPGKFCVPRVTRDCCTVLLSRACRCCHCQCQLSTNERRLQARVQLENPSPAPRLRVPGLRGDIARVESRCLALLSGSLNTATVWSWPLPLLRWCRHNPCCPSSVTLQSHIQRHRHYGCSTTYAVKTHDVDAPLACTCQPLNLPIRLFQSQTQL